MPIYFKVPTLLGGSVFYAADVAWNLVAGSIMYWDFPLKHGFTFSQRTEYWMNADGSPKRTKVAAFWTFMLNWWLNDHIIVKVKENV